MPGDLAHVIKFKYVMYLCSKTHHDFLTNEEHVFLVHSFCNTLYHHPKKPLFGVEDPQ